MADIPDNWVELSTREAFLRAVNSREGVIVITDSANGTKAHDPRCPFVTLDHFEKKVILNSSASGTYSWAPSRESALAGGAQACRSPADPI